MKMQIVPHESVLIIDVQGRLDGRTAMEFQEQVHASLGEGKGPIVIDCKNLAYISSAGLRAMLTIAKTLQRLKSRLAICSLSPMNARVFHTTGFHRIIPISETRAEALEAVSE